MRALRNLSIGKKLACSALVAILLLGGLAWSMLAGLARLQAVQATNAGAFNAERAVHAAAQAAQQAANLAQRLRLEQDAEAARLVGSDIGVQADLVRTALNQALQAESEPRARKVLERARRRVDAFASDAKHLLDLRNATLGARDKTFLPLRRSFDGLVQSVSGSTHWADMDNAAAEMMKTRLDRYRQSVDDIAGATLDFLMTSDTTLQGRVTTASKAAEMLIGALRQAGVEPGVREAFDRMAKAGTGIVSASTELFRGQAETASFIAGELSPTAKDMQEDIAVAERRIMDKVQAARQDAAATQKHTRDMMLLISLGITAALIVSGFLTSRAIARPIRNMTDAVQAMATGDTGVKIGFAGRRDEIGRMAAALETLRGEVTSAFMQGQMIEQLPVGIMTISPEGDFPITYLNAEMKNVLTLVQDSLPVPVEEVQGKSIDIFHRQPERQREILSDPANLPHRARISLGGETLDLIVSAIRARDGNYAGAMLSWTRATDQARLAERFEQSVMGVARSVGGSAETMRATAEAMSETAGESSRRAAAVGAASTQAAQNVQSVGASAEELAASVAEIGRQVSESARIAGQAADEAAATDQCVTGLSDAAQRIGDVVRLIGDIASRTNLLALNATIEAARAGEAGRGFAVVAGEVKTLANQTAKATEEIAAQIGGMQGETQQAVAALRSIGATITRMNEIATAIAGAVEEQGAATEEIARAVQQAALGTSDVTSNIETVSGAVDATGRQAGEVLQAASALSTQAETLKTEVDQFLQAMRVAA